jgi:hypothetical protein
MRETWINGFSVKKFSIEMADTVASTIATEDQVTLINNQLHPARSRNVVLIFALFKVLPWLAYIYPDGHSYHSTALFAVFILLDLWICRRTLGYSLVGLSWSLNFPTEVLYRFEPDPFVPSAVDSNIFWISLFVHCFVLVVVALINLLRGKFWIFCVLATLSGLDLVNIVLYLKCLLLAKKQSEDAFRNVMVYAPQQFPIAEDVNLDDVGKNQEAPPLETEKVNDD